MPSSGRGLGAYVDKRLESLRARTQREISIHERGDKRILTFAGAVVVAVVGAAAAIGRAVIENAGEKHKNEAVVACTAANDKRIKPLEDRINQLREDVKDLNERHRRAERECRRRFEALPRMDPDLIRGSRKGR